MTNLKKTVLISAGRKENLEILFLFLEKMKDEFDDCILLSNTTNNSDLEYVRLLADKFSWVSVLSLQEAMPKNFEDMRINLTLFYELLPRNNDTVYLRIDDDICFIEKNAIKKMFLYKELNKNIQIVYGNIVNNAIISKIYLDDGIVNWPTQIFYNCVDSESWGNPKFAEMLHYKLIKKIRDKRVSDLYIQSQPVHNFSRFSMNAICFDSNILNEIDQQIKEIIDYMGIPDEEEFLTSVLPKRKGVENHIVGDAIFSHYAFFVQKNYLDKTNILDMYLKIANGL